MDILKSTLAAVLDNCKTVVPASAQAAAASAEGRKMSPEEKDAARKAIIEKHRVLMRNLETCGLVDGSSIRAFERSVEKDERRRRRETRHRMEKQRGPLPVYTENAQAQETVLEKA